MLKLIRSLALPVSLLALLGATRLAVADDSVSGRWKLSMQVEQEKKEYDLVLKQEGNKVSGELISPRSGRKDAFDGGSIEGSKLKFEVKRQNEEVYACELEKKSAAKFEGKLLVNGRGPIDLVLTRAASSGALVGKWSVISKSRDGQEYPSTLELTEEAGALKGKSTSTALGAIALEKAVFDGEKLEIDLTLPIEGNNVPFRIAAEFKDPNNLVGRWKTRDADFSGEWTASRDVPAVAPTKPAEPAVKPVAPPAPAPAPTPAAPAVKELSGKWHAIVVTADGKKSAVFELTAEGDKVSGKVHTSKGDSDVKSGKASGKKVEFSFPYKGDQGDIEIKVEAELDAAGALKGRWSIPSGESGDLKAMKPVVL